MDFVTLDVFTQTRFLGNPLAIAKVPHSTTLTQETKQTIAREFNYSETVFIHLPAPDTKSEIPEWKIDIFLVNAEVPFAGHPTIGTAVYALSTLSKTARGRFICKAGPIDLFYDADSRTARAGIPFAIHRHERAYDIPSLYALQPALQRYMRSASQELRAEDVDVVSVVRGMTFIFVRLPSVDALGSLGLHGAGFDFQRDEGWDQGVLMSMYYVPLESDDGTIKLRTRMIEGMFEDPATGSASCGLAALLALKKGVKGEVVKVEMTQAVEMGRQSDIGVDVTMDGKGEVEKIELVGSAVEVMEGRVKC
ncbi:hypothetical protein MBLNU457_7459t1 [Dothideomycetes sp. NU457]